MDQRIRKDSSSDSLDNFIRDMVSKDPRPLTPNRVLETAGRHLSPASRADLVQIVKAGSLIPILGTALGPCAGGSVDEISTFNLGFDLSASQAAGMVTGVDSGRLSVRRQREYSRGRKWLPSQTRHTAFRSALH